MEFFLEAGRTRSGKILPPKSGLLSVIVEAYLEGHIPDAYLVPVNFSYEKLLEGSFSSELMVSGSFIPRYISVRLHLLSI